MKTKIDGIQIAAITAYLPKSKIALTSFAEIFGIKEVENIINVTGIENVHIADKSETSSDMCLNAAKYLIEKEKLDLDKIDGIVFVSQTTDYILPATSIILQDRLGLSKKTICIDIHYGCSGYIYGIFQAALWINIGACEQVLVLAGDTTTAMIHDQDKSLRMVFGDCGTATLVTRGDTSINISLNSDGSGFERLIIPAGGARLPASNDTKQIIVDEDNNRRTSENLFMDGMAIFNFAISNVHKDINSLIEYANWFKDDVKIYALHQANRFMVNYIRKKLKVEESKVPINIKDYGNTGPATIPLLLCDLYHTSTQPLDKVIMSGFGVGLSWGSIACNLDKTKFYEPLNKK